MNSSEASTDFSAEAKKSELVQRIEELTSLVGNLKRMAEMSPSSMTEGGYFDSAGSIVADAEKALLKAQMELEALNPEINKTE